MANESGVQLFGLEIGERRRPFGSGRGSIIQMYTLFGAPIGGMLTSTIAFAFLILPQGLPGIMHDFQNNPIGSIFSIPMILGLGALYGYLFGGLQALACGILLAILSDPKGRFSYLQAFLAALGTAGFALLIFHLAISTDWWGSLFLVAAGPPSSLILRFLFRNHFRPLDKRGPDR